MATEIATPEVTENLDARRRELISFRIGAQEFCVDIMAIREIRGYAKATPLPHAPPFVRGVINLRGQVLPVVDLAARLGFESAETVARQVIIVAHVGGDLVGLMVDAVSDILTVTDDVIQPTPDLASEATKTLVRGLIAIDGRMISLVVLDGLLSVRQLEAA